MELVNESALKKVKFSLYSPDQIINLAVVEVNNIKKSGENSVYDLRMGPLNNDQACVTCKQNSNDGSSAGSNSRGKLIVAQSYWQSPEAARDFSEIGNEVEDGESLVEIVEKQIKKLSQALTLAQGWKLVLDDFDTNKLCTEHDISVIQQRC